MERDGKQCLIIDSNCCLQKAFPKHVIFLPSWAQIPRIAIGYPFDSRNGKLRYLNADTRRHAEKEIGGIRQRTAETPYPHQYFPKQGSRAVFCDERNSIRGVRDVEGVSADSLPPAEILEVEIEQQDWTAPSTLASALVYPSPKIQMPVEGAFRRYRLRVSGFRQHCKASCIELSQGRYCFQTGPLARRVGSVISFHFPIRSCGYGGGFSTSS